jgi:hypothetical protein
MGNMKIGLLSFIDIYSGGGIKVVLPSALIRPYFAD